MFFVYILINANGKYYVGQTNNLNKRLYQHNNDRFGYTRIFRPWKLVYYESFTTRTFALKREKEIKSYKGGLKFKQLLVL